MNSSIGILSHWIDTKSLKTTSNCPYLQAIWYRVFPLCTFSIWCTVIRCSRVMYCCASRESRFEKTLGKNVRRLKIPEDSLNSIWYVGVVFTFYSKKARSRREKRERKCFSVFNDSLSGLSHHGNRVAANLSLLTKRSTGNLALSGSNVIPLQLLKETWRKSWCALDALHSILVL